MNVAFAARERKASFVARAFGNAVGLARSAIKA